MLILLKEKFDEKVIDSTLEIISKHDVNALKLHIVYTGDYYFFDREEKLRSLILKGMKKHKIKSVMVTRIYLAIYGLITKENMEKYYNGKKKEKESVNDDLDAFFQNLQLGKDDDKNVETYYLPKLTEEELELIKRKDPEYLRNFLNKINQVSFAGFKNPKNPGIQPTHVTGAGMVLPRSDSIFLEGWFFRRTYTVTDQKLSQKILKILKK